MILDGKKVANEILEEIKEKVAKLDKKPHLAVVLVGNDLASQIYVRNKKKTANMLGITSTVLELPEETKEEVLLNEIKKLNKDSDVTGILVQMPLPKHIDKMKVIMAIDPKKDVDCFTPENVGKLSIGMEPYFYPVTPQGIMILLKRYGIEVAGKHAVIIGRSNIVGKPMIQLLLKNDATVTVCHSKTENLEEIIKTADIVISAVGKKVVRCKMVKNKAVFVDVGISRDTNGKLTGDLNWELDFKNFDEVLEYFEYISPVPGGVGPMTIASLMLNVLASK
ncbi:TPA: bifunctional methylenetetrahydrofolate dehydrogenase/methenyltetrahydrofolate cyclohydrolase [Candidatus Gastranaerophilales bacterium HUM_9]|nr:MAG TPA: bifunctional methylenetetrahydrofolate dehydrogenase/methenyltetrahydrofolate cyclohydrolase [Candidatus Gastranaerophilales bacterium HUM_9]HBX35054.1 bifunctional methylenetetrahydrofolate dehydrogenase/methenyltetrahydrofolate cyclohydrolase [Cyanobacteria bacterium UBA11440]